MTPEEVQERWERVIVKAIELLEEERIRREKERFFYLVGSPPLPSEEPYRLTLFLEYLVHEVPVHDRLTPFDLILRSPAIDREIISDAERFHRSYLALGEVKKVKKSELELKLHPTGERIAVRVRSADGMVPSSYVVTRIIPYDGENFLPATTEVLEARHRAIYLRFIKGLLSTIPPQDLWLATLLWNHLVRQFPSAQGEDLFRWFVQRLRERNLLYEQIS